MASDPDPGALERLRAEHFGGEIPRVQVEFGAMSHVGKRKPNNEDHYMVVRRFRDREILMTNLPPGTLRGKAQEAFVISVADGLGGASFGEIASMLALRSGWDLGERAFKWHFNLSSKDEARDLESMARLYGQLIHEEILKSARESPKQRGMGTTLACMMSVGLEAVVAHAGDSRVYLHRRGALHALTKDHTLAEAMGGAPLDPDSDQSIRKVLVNCLGADQQGVQIDTTRLRIESGDLILVCTDGLTEMVPDPEIARVLGAARKCQAAAEELVALALKNGGLDNVTVVVARYREQPKS